MANAKEKRMLLILTNMCLDWHFLDRYILMFELICVWTDTFLTDMCLDRYMFGTILAPILVFSNFVTRVLLKFAPIKFTNISNMMFVKSCTMHSGEKSNKCNQCDFASSYASALRAHLKTHSGEKSIKCNQCDYASMQVEESQEEIKRLQQMWLCILWSRQLEDTFKITKWRKVN